MKESKQANIIWGLIFIIAGVIFLGNALNMWEVELFFDGWWTLFIIVPSIVGIFRHGARLSSFTGIIIGTLLFLACQDIIGWGFIWKAFIPVIFIMIGLSLIFRPKTKFEKKVVRKDDKGILDYVAIFSGQEEKIENNKFEGANCISVFGSIDLDLRKAKIKEDVVIECVSVFGSSTILVPDDVNVKTSGVPIFGGIESKFNENDTKKPTIFIEYTCVFGGVDVK